MSKQQKILLAYQQFRASPPTAGKLMRRHWRVLLLLAAVTGAAACLGLFLQLHLLAWLMAGMFIGALARDFGTCRQAARAWPTINAVIDWKRVDELLAERER